MLIARERLGSNDAAAKRNQNKTKTRCHETKGEGFFLLTIFSHDNSFLSGERQHFYYRSFKSRGFIRLVSALWCDDGFVSTTAANTTCLICIVYSYIVSRYAFVFLYYNL